jgi:hypothetical protein
LSGLPRFWYSCAISLARRHFSRMAIGRGANCGCALQMAFLGKRPIKVSDVDQSDRLIGRRPKPNVGCLALLSVSIPCLEKFDKSRRQSQIGLWSAGTGCPKLGSHRSGTMP